MPRDTNNLNIDVQGDKKQSFMSLLLELQSIVSDTTDKVFKRYGRDSIKPSCWAAVVILNRINESVKAGTILVSQGFNRDAAVLITNQMELRLDMQYISQDYTRAKTWLNDSNSFRKPWKIRMLLEALFTDEKELEAEKKLYKQYSMVKHGNPLGETFAFPLAVRDSYLILPPQEDVLCSNFMLFIYIFFNELFRSLKAAIIDFNRCQIEVKELEKKADFIRAMMEKLWMKHLLEQLSLLNEITPKPELCDSCTAIPDNHIEITCLLKRKDNPDNFTCDKYRPK